MSSVLNQTQVSVSRIAYLIMAHAVNEELDLLVRTLLLDDRSRIYVHIDAKVKDLGWLAHRAEPRLTVLDNRIIVNWGGYSVVKATLLLLDYAFRDDQNLRFVLLSGACFPIQPPQAVNDNILAQQTPVVSIWGKIDASLKANEGFGRYTVTKYHPLDVRGVNPKRGRALERIWIFEISLRA